MFLFNNFAQKPSKTMYLKFCYNFLLDEGQSQVQTWKYLSRLLLSFLKAFFQEKNLDSLQSRPKNSALS